MKISKISISKNLSILNKSTPKKETNETEARPNRKNQTKPEKKPYKQKQQNAGLVQAHAARRIGF
jgi:hypothetical protein